MKLALIPPGEFEMGSPPSDIVRARHELQHRVRITKPFYMGIHEVTQREYQAVMGKNPSFFSPSGAGKDQVHDLDTKQFPVEGVSWHDAVEFCRRLSALPAEQTAGRVYHLPTEAEWEFACRAGSSGAFCFGNDEAMLPSYGLFAGNANDRTWPAATRLANAWGLFDMHGNVWEWCSDWHGAYGADPVNDPTGASFGSHRVLRGGAFNYGATSCRCPYRFIAVPLIHYPDDGFRVAMAAKAISPLQPDGIDGKASNTNHPVVANTSNADDAK
ncbi:MAG TPA: formylglycine-generating enzyme family protein [Pirellulales bacterium]|nr:formylglycine-generating enzyme family protein [Pirellulales bacterium]